MGRRIFVGNLGDGGCQSKFVDGNIGAVAGADVPAFFNNCN